MAVAMSEPQAVGPPSLDRLKALDSRPDLTSQLEEATRLCTHAARADMIAKWLLEKLKSSDEVRQNCEVWECLLRAFRLLSPGRVAALLSSHNFNATVTTTLEYNWFSRSVLFVLSDTVNFLCEVSEGTEGAPVKALLSTDAEQAARLFGLWLQRTCDAVASGAIPDFGRDFSSTLRPALRVWDLRRRSIEENEYFASHCLTSVASLLSIFSPSETVKPSKRKRHYEGIISSDDCLKTLESLLGRHIFLPARTAFFKATDSTKSNTKAYKDPASTIGSMLDPLKRSIAERQAVDGKLSGVLPPLLDVALRCASTPTPRQRTKEKPWVEAVFDALHECHKDSSGNLGSEQVLVNMLKVVNAYTSLSKERLEQILRRYSRISTPNEKIGWDSATHVNWVLVAQVTELDADVFSDENLAETLFTSLTRASVDLGQSEGHDDAGTHSNREYSARTESLHDKFLNQIIVPVMEAFAKRRKLLKFVDLWSHQLHRDRHNYIWSVWMELDGKFQSLLEDSIPQDQISELFNQLSGKIESGPDASKSNEDNDSGYDFDSSIVVMNAILGGLRSESLLKELWKDCERNFERLLQLVGSSTNTLNSQVASTVREKRVWALMRRLFEIWFPFWAAEQSERGPIAERLGSLVSSDAVQVALTVSKSTRSNKSASATSLQEASEAECFVSCIYSHSGPYQESMDILDSTPRFGIIGRFIGQLDTQNPEAVLQYPALLNFVEGSEPSHEFLFECVWSTMGKVESDGWSVSTLQPLHAVVDTVVNHAEADIIDQLVEIAAELLPEIQNYQKDDEDETEHTMKCKQQVVIEVMSRLALFALSRPQREKILNAICSTDFFGTQTKEHEPYLRKRLAVMIKLMDASNATSILSTDASAIWRLAMSTSAKEFVRPGTGHSTGTSLSNGSSHSTRIEEPQTVALLDELVSLIVQHLLSTQEQERSQSMLIEMSTDVCSILDFVGVDFTVESMVHENFTPLALIGSIIRALGNGAKDDLKQRLPHLKNWNIDKLTRKLCSALNESAMTIERMYSYSPAPTMETEFKVILDLLLMATELCPETMASQREGLTSLFDSLVQHLDKLSIDGTAKFASCLKTIFVRLCEIDCKLASDSDIGNLTSTSVQLLDMGLPPADMKVLVDAFEKRTGRFNYDTMIALIQSLLTEQPVVPAQNLLLLQPCIAQLQKDDSNTTQKGTLYQLLPKLLFTANEDRTPLARRRATNCIVLMLKEKSFLTNQFSIEESLMSLPKYLDDESAYGTAYLDACRIMSTIFLNHRSRLQGRFHLVNNVFQALLSGLFSSNSKRSSDQGRATKIGPAHAQALTRLLTLYCEPLHLRRQSKGPELVDESRKEQAHVGRYVPYVLHHYCTEVLHGSLDEGVREALTPGLWAMIEAIEINDADGMRYLSACMNNSERAVLRDVYENWKRLGKWRGG